MCSGLWFQLFPRPVSVLDLLTGKWFDSTAHLSVPDREIETQPEWLQSVGGSFSGLKRSPRVGHKQLLRKRQGPTLLLSFWLIISSTGFCPHGHRWLLGFQLSFLHSNRKGTHPNQFRTLSQRISWKLHNDVYCSFFTLNYKESWEPLLCLGTPSP